MQEDNNNSYSITVTVSDGNLTYSSDLDPQSTVFWLRAVEWMIMNATIGNTDGQD